MAAHLVGPGLSPVLRSWATFQQPGLTSPAGSTTGLPHRLLQCRSFFSVFLNTNAHKCYFGICFLVVQEVRGKSCWDYKAGRTDARKKDQRRL